MPVSLICAWNSTIGRISATPRRGEAASAAGSRRIPAQLRGPQRRQNPRDPSGPRTTIRPGTIVVFDRGYNDYHWFESLAHQGVWFVTRMIKDHADFVGGGRSLGACGEKHSLQSSHLTLPACSERKKSVLPPHRGLG